MHFLVFLPQFVSLLFAIINEVHTVQTTMGANSGAERSQAVLDKVTPIANLVNAEAPHIQSIIDGVVAISKAAGVGAFAAQPVAEADPAAGQPDGQTVA